MRFQEDVARREDEAHDLVPDFGREEEETAGSGEENSRRALYRGMGFGAGVRG